MLYMGAIPWLRDSAERASSSITPRQALDESSCASTRIAVPAALALLMWLLMAMSFSARAEHGRDFSALYDIGRVTGIDAHRVSVTLLLRLRNNSGRYV